MKKNLSLLCFFPKRAIFDPSPLHGITSENAIRHRSRQNRRQFGLFAAPLDEMIAPPYHPGLLLKIYNYSYLNRVRSSQRLEFECG